jgi:hypothetical protein
LEQTRQPIVALLGPGGGRQTRDEQRRYGVAKDKLWNGHERSSLVFWLWAHKGLLACRITNSRFSRTLGWAAAGTRFMSTKRLAFSRSSVILDQSPI